jgi:serine/threonine-protein kinase
MKQQLGHSLKDCISDRALTQEKATQLVCALAIQLESAHQSDQIYGNLTPSSISICDDGGVRIEAVTTFSVSDSESVPYASPALKHQSAPFPQCDIYSLGVMYYELLTGSLPPTPYLPPSRMRSVLPEIDNFISRAIHFNPEFQYETSREVSQALKKIRQKLAPQKSLTPIQVKSFSQADPSMQKVVKRTSSPAKKKKSFLKSLFSSFPV